MLLLTFQIRPRTGSCSSSISVGAPGKPLYLSDIQRAEQSMPNLQQRAELLRIAEAMHTSSTATTVSAPAHSAGLPLPPNIRSSSQDRECKLLLKDFFSRDFLVDFMLLYFSAINRIHMFPVRRRYSKPRFSPIGPW